MDLVYLVRSGEINDELKISLRSIEKYAPKYKNIFIVGYKPSWVNNKVMYLPTNQTSFVNGWINAKLNLMVACKSDIISDNFILMNDDFIATRPIKNWKKSISKVKNTLEEQTIEYNNMQLTSRYSRAFPQAINILKTIDRDMPTYNYELHIPMIINKKKFLDLLNIESVAWGMSNTVTLYRSLYGNIYNVEFDEIMDDVKFYDNDPAEINTEWISVFDGWIGDKQKYPVLNQFIDENFSEKSRFEI